MTDIKVINGISYHRKQVRGISCTGCIFLELDLTCKLLISIHKKCVDSHNYNDTYIITGIANNFTKIKII